MVTSFGTRYSSKIQALPVLNVEGRAENVISGLEVSEGLPCREPMVKIKMHNRLKNNLVCKKLLNGALFCEWVMGWSYALKWDE